MDITQVLSLLQVAVALLTSAISNPHITIAEKQQAISFAQQVVTIATMPQPKAPDGHWENRRYVVNTPNPSQDPIVYLEGIIEKSDGSTIHLKGRNRDSHVKELGLARDSYSTINPNFVQGFFATSSLSKQEKVSVFIGTNPNVKNISCRKTSGEWWNGPIDAKDHTEVLPIDSEKIARILPYSYHRGRFEIGFSVTCSSKRVDTWYQEVESQSWDTLTIDFVE